MFSSRSYKKTEKSNFLTIFGKINVLASPRQCDFTFPKKRKPTFRPGIERQNLKHLVKYPVLMSSRQCENTFPIVFVFCWAKMFSKRYRSNKDSVKIMFWWFFHVLFHDFSCFLVCFVTTGWFPKRWANLQTRAKLGSPQNTPNTVFKRPSKLIISVIFDGFTGLITLSDVAL